MFSYYEKGCKSQEMNAILDIDSLIREIKTNRNQETIVRIWSLPYRSKEYDDLKINLPCITPAGVFMKGRLKESIFQLSGYLFFDIDCKAVDMPIEHLRYKILEDYKEYISVLGTSVGGRGLFFYVKVNGVTKDNYEAVYEFLRTVVFSKLKIDNNAKGINRPQIVPFDERLYYNDSVSIDIPIDLYSRENRINKKETLPIKKEKRECYTGSVSFLDIGQVLAKIVLVTKVDVGDTLFKIDPVPYFKIHIPRTIPDTRKHATFRAFTQGLMFLNPGIDLLTVQSYINFVNQKNTDKPMRTKELLRTVEEAYNRVSQTGEYHIPITIRCFHINRRAVMSKKDKLLLASKVNGLLKIKKTIELIENAKYELEQAGLKPTQLAIAKRSGISLKTVSRHVNKNAKAIGEEISSLNYKIS